MHCSIHKPWSYKTLYNLESTVTFFINGDLINMHLFQCQKAFFPVRGRAVFRKSCHLIGSVWERNFLIRPAHRGHVRCMITSLATLYFFIKCKNTHYIHTGLWQEPMTRSIRLHWICRDRVVFRLIFPRKQTFHKSCMRNYYPWDGE